MAIISKGNIKVGKIANVSLTPIESCAGMVDHCAKDCYAMKAYRQYPAVRKAWNTNFKQARDDLIGYFADVQKFLVKYKGGWFRWHVGGDILSSAYLIGMDTTARLFPHIKFLCFTKQYHIVSSFMGEHGELAPNLQLVLSAWSGLELYNPDGFPVAWMDDGTDTRIPDDALPCPGFCESCGMCWNLSSIKRDVVFKKH